LSLGPEHELSLSSSHDDDDFDFRPPSDLEQERHPSAASQVSDADLKMLSDSRVFRAPTPEPDRERRPLAYASLPPSPISSSPPPSQTRVPTSVYSDSGAHHHQPPFSLWDYLREELLSTDFDSHQELKWERVSNFLAIPLAMEKVGFEFYDLSSSEILILT